MASNASLKPEIGPDGLARESPIIAYTEKVIAQEQLQLHKYIEENRSMLLGVERELANLSMEMKLTAGPKKAGWSLLFTVMKSHLMTEALEHLRKKIEISSEKIHQAKVKEEQARKAWEAAVQALKDEESMKQKLCEDLNQLVQESSSSQFTRLEELKRRLEALNPNRASSASPHSGQPVGPTQNNAATGASSVPPPTAPGTGENTGNAAANQEQNSQVPNGSNQQHPASGGAKKKAQVHGKGRGVLGAVPKRSPGWTGAGFDVDGRN
ncbi:unnamed protein product [Linum tenue]|uniref:RAB6-interacting golgin n=1 Tax=Linum tenue TaxID=586396 RepID=A0AAV0QS81_9ROSI|nr:unnamed protein product [Linum tenue]